MSIGASASANTYDLGNLSAISPASKSVTHTFDAGYFGSFTDIYKFSVEGDASSISGQTVERDGYVQFFFWNILLKDLEVTSLTLTKVGDPSFATIVDTTPESFVFSPLSAGSYQLALVGSVLLPSTVETGSASTNGLSSYTLTASATAPVASAAPEASDLALTALGLTGVALWTRRRKAA